MFAHHRHGYEYRHCMWPYFSNAGIAMFLKTREQSFGGAQSRKAALPVDQSSTAFALNGVCSQQCPKCPQRVPTGTSSQTSTAGAAPELRGSGKSWMPRRPREAAPTYSRRCLMARCWPGASRTSRVQRRTSLRPFVSARLFPFFSGMLVMSPP